MVNNIKRKTIKSTMPLVSIGIISCTIIGISAVSMARPIPHYFDGKPTPRVLRIIDNSCSAIEKGKVSSIKNDSYSINLKGGGKNLSWSVVNKVDKSLSNLVAIGIGVVGKPVQIPIGDIGHIIYDV